MLSDMNSPTELLPRFERTFPPQNEPHAALAQLTELKKYLDGFLPLDAQAMEKLQESLDTVYTYESNRIEGNTLTLRETSLIINDGIAVGGKSMREHLEAINHRDAIAIMRAHAAGAGNIDSKILLTLHNQILRTIDDHNAGKYRTVRVGVRGSTRIFPNPAKVPELIEAAFSEFANHANHTPTRHPIELATRLHHQLVYVHPFADGNGRTARLMQNLVLLRHGYLIANIKGADSDRHRYYEALQKADDGNPADFQQLIYAAERQALFDHLSLAASDISPQAQEKGIYLFERMASQT